MHDVREHVEALRVAEVVGRMRIELRGLELFGHHGVSEEERERGQLFLYDVELEVGERGANDRIEDAVDYREVAATVRRIADGRFALLEALASAIADALVARVRARARQGASPQAGGAPGRNRPGVRGRHRRAPLTRAFVGLGANLGDRETTIRRAAERLGAPGSRRFARPSRGARRPAAFLNAVAELDTELTPQALLDRLLDVERSLGRVRDEPTLGAQIDVSCQST